MRKLILAFALVVGLTAFAQEKNQKGIVRKTPEQQIEATVAKMKQELNLNDKQQSEVKTAMMEQSDKRKARRDEFKARKEKGEKLSEQELEELKNARSNEESEMNSKMKKILNSDQYTKWLERKNELTSNKRNEKGKRKVEPSENK